MALTNLDRVVLYWFWNPFLDDDDWPEAMGMVGVHTNPEAKDRHLRERECFVSGTALPTYDDALKSLQHLVDEGLVRAGELNDIRSPEIDRWEIPIWLTTQGKKEGRAFDRFLGSEEGRRRTLEFARNYVASCAAGLPFRPIIPTYLPRSTDPLPEVIVGDDSVSLNYDDAVVEQARTTLPQRHHVTPNTEVLHEDSINGITVSISERHLTSVWAEIEHVWRISDMFFRLTYLESGRPPTADVALEYAVISDSTRREARKILRSIIEQVHNQAAFPTN